VLLVPSTSIPAKYFMPEELTRSPAAILVELKIMLAFFRSPPKLVQCRERDSIVADDDAETGGRRVSGMKRMIFIESFL
jgi:hypothetical protein